MSREAKISQQTTHILPFPFTYRIHRVWQLCWPKRPWFCRRLNSIEISVTRHSTIAQVESTSFRKDQKNSNGNMLKLHRCCKFWLPCVNVMDSVCSKWLIERQSMGLSCSGVEPSWRICLLNSGAQFCLDYFSNSSIVIIRLYFFISSIPKMFLFLGVSREERKKRFLPDCFS